MNENFCFDVHRRRDVAHLFKCQFPGQCDSPELQPSQCFGPGTVVDSELRAGVQSQLWKVFPNEVIDAEVLDDERIDANFGQGRNSFDQFRQLVLADQSIDAHEDTPPRLETVRIGSDLIYLFQRKVLRLGTSRELLQTQIDRIGSEVKRRETCFQSTRRSQQFHMPRGRAVRCNNDRQRNLAINNGLRLAHDHIIIASLDAQPGNLQFSILRKKKVPSLTYLVLPKHQASLRRDTLILRGN